VLTNGFRPFFLAAGLWAAVALLIWLGVLAGGLDVPTRFDPTAWHVHEMLFGFVPAAVAGFLLTAVPNWTGRLPVAGVPLAGVVLLWLAGRIACLVSAWLPPWLAVGVDLAFPVAFAAVMARELVIARNRRNLMLLLPMTVLILGSLLMHLESLGVVVPEGLGWRLGLAMVVVLISVIGGRVVPSFTRNWLNRQGAVRLPGAHGAVDRAALASLHTAMLAWAVLPDQPAVGVLLLAASGLNLWRLARWRGTAAWTEPLLAVLHLGYAWMVAGTALLGLSLLTVEVPMSGAVHALTLGAAGTMILAVMTRATLGHTGRALQAGPTTVAIYGLITAATLARLAGAWAGGLPLLVAAGLLWSAAFLLFAAVYGPMLLVPRRRPAH